MHIRYISSISQVYLRYISYISQTYLRYISRESQVFLRCISGKSLAYFRFISGISLVHLRWKSSISYVWLMYISTMAQVYHRQAVTIRVHVATSWTENLHWGKGNVNYIRLYIERYSNIAFCLSQYRILFISFLCFDFFWLIYNSQ